MSLSRRSSSESSDRNGRVTAANRRGSGDGDPSHPTRVLTVATITALVVGLVCVAAVAPGAVAQPQPPASYYGNVTVDGEPAEVGTEVQALVDGDVEDTITVEEAGQYGGPDAFDEKLVVRNASAGDTVQFAVDGETTDQTVDWESGDVQRVDLAIGSSSSDGDGNDDENTADGGGGGGGSAGTGTEGETDGTEGPSVIREAQADVEADPETGQARATFDDESPVESVTIDSDSVEGSVSVTELEREPESTGPAPGSPVSVMEITVPDDAADTPGTVRTNVPRERLEQIAAEPENLRITRHVDGRWQILETEVAETTDAKVVLEAETPGFSYFAVSAVGDPTAEIDAPDQIAVGDELTLDASGSTVENGEIVAYDWTVGEANLSGESVTLTIAESGEVTVDLTVETDAGETDTATHTVVVGDAEPDGQGSSDEGDAGDGSDDSADGGFGSTVDEIPGFGAPVTLVALLTAALLAVRRRNI